MHNDYPLESETGTGHGGSREGSGRKPLGYVKPKEVVDFEAARARNEAAKADQNELDYQIKSGQYVSRAAVKQAIATIMSGLAQSLRSIPDNLERQGVPLEVCVQVEGIVGETLDSAAADMQLFAGPAEGNS